MCNGNYNRQGYALDQSSSHLSDEELSNIVNRVSPTLYFESKLTPRSAISHECKSNPKRFCFARKPSLAVLEFLSW